MPFPTIDVIDAHTVLKTINTTPNAGQATMANSLPVVLPSDQPPVPVNTLPGTAGGTSTYCAPGGTGNPLLTNSPVAIKSSPGNLYSVMFVNTGASAAYVQAFDLATGSVTLGTTVPKKVWWVPPGGAWEEKFGDCGAPSFGTAITFAATTTPTGSVAPATGILANVLFK